MVKMLMCLIALFSIFSGSANAWNNSSDSENGGYFVASIEEMIPSYDWDLLANYLDNSNALVLELHTYERIFVSGVPRFEFHGHLTPNTSFLISLLDIDLETGHISHISDGEFHNDSASGWDDIAINLPFVEWDVFPGYSLLLVVEGFNDDASFLPELKDNAIFSLLDSKRDTGANIELRRTSGETTTQDESGCSSSSATCASKKGGSLEIMLILGVLLIGLARFLRTDIGD